MGSAAAVSLEFALFMNVASFLGAMVIGALLIRFDQKWFALALLAVLAFKVGSALHVGLYKSIGDLAAHGVLATFAGYGAGAVLGRWWRRRRPYIAPQMSDGEAMDHVARLASRADANRGQRRPG